MCRIVVNPAMLTLTPKTMPSGRVLEKKKKKKKKKGLVPGTAQGASSAPLRDVGSGADARDCPHGPVQPALRL